MAPCFEKWGYETERINLVDAGQHTICRNRISGVGEGVDTYATGGLVAWNRFERCHNFGVKLSMARKAMRSSGTRFWDSGLAGVVLAGSPTPGKRDCAYNRIAENRISGIDAEGAWAGHGTACILFQPNKRPRQSGRVQRGRAKTGSIRASTAPTTSCVWVRGLINASAIRRCVTAGKGGRFPPHDPGEMTFSS